MKRFCVYSLLSLFSVCLLACSDKDKSGDGNDTDYYIHPKIGESDISDLFFTGKGGSYVVEIDTNDKISVSDNKDWCDVSALKNSSSSKTSFEVRVKPNEESSKREAVITIKGKKVTKTITISQDIKRPVVNPGAMSKDAKAIAAEMFAGFNMGNSLEAYNQGTTDPETSWGNPKITKAMVDAVANAGFNGIRIPVRWYPHFTDASTAKVDEKWMNRVKEVVGYCLDNDMYVIINTHHEHWLESFPFYKDSTEVYRKEYALWTQIANAFKDYDERLLFAGTNEVHVPDEWGRPVKAKENTDVQNGYNQIFVDAVRATGGNNKVRNLIVQTYCTNSDWGPELFVMPKDPTPNRLMVEVHYYDPWPYSGLEQEKFWGKPYAQYGAGTQGQENDMEARFAMLKKEYVDAGYPIIVGECGANRHEDKDGDATKIRESRAYYFQTMASITKKYGAVPFIWDNGAIGKGADKFGVFDRRNGMKNTDVQTTTAMMKGASSVEYPF